LAQIADVQRAYQDHKLTASAALEATAALSRKLGDVTAVFITVPER
jgi:hypothetical protein